MKITFLAALASIAFASVSIAVSPAPETVLSAAQRARIARFDQGPAKIDVSAYPRGAQADYRVFRERCSLCHTLSRPINSDFALPNEWSLYLLRMIAKPGSNISGNDSKRIYDFLIYDSSVRKKALLDKKLANLDSVMRSAMLAKIESIRTHYHTN